MQITNPQTNRKSRTGNQHSSKQRTRSKFRALRQALSIAEQHQAALALAQRLTSHPIFLKSQHIAFYMASDGELDPDYLLRVAWAAGKSCYLPCIRKRFGQPRENYLWFGRTQPNSVLRTNKYGIPEPDLRIETVISAKALDLVLMPLVAFDEQGNRLGMGKGYFDQTFAFIRHGPTWHRPKLMGLAHECQKSNSLISNDWDVPLDAIATDCQIYLSSNHIPQEI